MQDHSTVVESTPLTFTHKQTKIKRNIAVISEIDAKMRNDYNVARRKLTNSAHSPRLRQINLMVGNRPSPSPLPSTHPHWAERDSHSPDTTNPNLQRIRELQYLLQKAREEIQILRRQLGEARAREYDGDRLRGQNNELIRKINYYSQLTQRTSILETQRESLVREIHVARASIDALKTTIHSLSEQNNHYKSRMMETSGRVTNQEEFTTLTRQLTTAQEERTSLTSIITELRINNQQLIHNLRVSGSLGSDELPILKSQISQLKAEREIRQTSLKQHISQLEQSRLQIQTKWHKEQEKSRQSQQKSLNLQQSLSKSREETSLFKNQLEGIQTNLVKLQRLKNDNEQLMQMLHNQTQLSQRASSLETQKQNLQFEVNTARINLQIIKNQAEALTNINNQLNHKLNTQERAHSLALERVQQLEQQKVNQIVQEKLKLYFQKQTLSSGNNGVQKFIQQQYHETGREETHPSTQEQPQSSFQERNQPSFQERPHPSAQEQPQSSFQERNQPSFQERPHPSAQEQPQSSFQERNQPSFQERPHPSAQEQPQSSFQERNQPSFQERPHPSAQEQPQSSFQVRNQPSFQERPHPSAQEQPQSSFQERNQPSFQERPHPSAQEQPQSSFQERNQPSFQERPHPSVQQRNSAQSSTTEMLRITDELDTVKNENFRFISQINLLKSNDDELRSRIRQMQLQGQVLNQDNQRIRQIHNDINRDYGILREKLDSSENKLRDIQKDKVHLNSILVQIQDDNSTLTNKLSQSQHQLRTLRVEMTQMKIDRQSGVNLESSNVNVLQSRVNDLERESMLERQKVLNYESTIKQLEYQIQKKTSQIESLRANGQGKQVNIFKMQRLERDNEQLKNKLSSQSQVTQKVLLLQNQNQTLKSELKSGQAQTEILKNDILVLTEKGKNLQEANRFITFRETESEQRLRTDLNNVTEELDHMRRDKTRVERTLDQEQSTWQQRHRELEYQVSTWKQQTELLQHNQIELKRSLYQVEDEKQLLRTKLMQKEEDNTKKVSYDELAIKLRKLEQQNQNIHLQLNGANQKIVSLEDNIRFLTEQIEFLKNKLIQAEGYIERLEMEIKIQQEQPVGLENTVNENRIVELEQQNRQKESIITNIIQNEQGYVETIKTLENQLRNTTNNFNTISQEVLVLKSTFNEPSQDNQGADFFKSKLIEAEQYIQILQTERDSMSSTIVELRNSSVTLGQIRVDTNQEEIVVLREELNSVMMQRERTFTTLKNENQKLETKTSQLEGILQVEKNKKGQVQKVVKQLQLTINNQKVQLEGYKSNQSSFDKLVASNGQLKRNQQELIKNLNVQTKLAQQIQPIEIANKVLKDETQKLKQTVSIFQKENQAMVEENVYLHNKIKEAELYIVSLESELQKRQGESVNVENKQIVSQEVLLIQQAKRQVEEQLKTTMEREKVNLLNVIRKLENDLLDVNKLLTSAQQEVQLAKIKAESRPIPESKEPQEEESAQFFRNKLLEAEEYIFIVEQEKSKIVQELQLSIKKAGHLQSQISKIQKQKIIAENQQKSLSSLVKELELKTQNIPSLVQEANKITQLSSTNKTLELEAIRIRQRINTVQNQKKTLENQLSEAQKNIFNFQGQKRTMQLKISQISQMTTVLQIDQQKLSAQKIEMTQKLTTIEGINKELADKSSYFEKHLQQAEEYIAVLESEKVSFQKQNIDRNAIQVESMSPIKNPIQVEDKTDQPQQEVQFLKNKLQEAESFINFIEGEKNRIEEELKVTVGQLIQIKVQRENSEKTLKEEQARHHEFENKLQVQLTQWRQKYVQIERAGYEYQSSWQKVLKDNEDLNKNIVLNNNKDNELKQLKRQKEQIEMALNVQIEIAQQIVPLQATQHNLQTEITNLRSHLSKIQNEKGLIELDVQRYSQQSSVILNLQKELENYQNRVSQYEIERKTFQTDRVRFEIEMTKVQEQKQIFEESERKFSEERLYFQQKLREAEITKVQEQNKVFEESEKKFSEESLYFQQKLREAEEYIVSLEKDLESQTTQLGDLNIEVTNSFSIRDRTAQLQQINRQIQGELNEIRVKEKNENNKVIELQRINKQTQAQISQMQLREKDYINKLAEVQKANLIIQTQLQKVRLEESNSVSRTHQIQLEKVKEQTKTQIQQIQLREKNNIVRIGSLEAQLKTVNNSLLSLQQQFATIKATEVPSYSQMSQNVPHDYSEEQTLQFFKKKLLEAESYIQFLQKEKFKVQNSLEMMTIKSRRQDDQILNFSKHLSDLKGQKTILSRVISQLKSTNQRLNENLNTVSKQQSNQEVVALAQQVEKLKNQNQTFNTSRGQYHKQVKKFEEKYENELKRAQVLEQKIKSTQMTYLELKTHSMGLEQKLRQAQSYISSLQELQKDNEQLLSKVSAYKQLSQKNSILLNQKNTIQKELTVSKTVIENLQLKIPVLKQESSYFKGKLLEAEGYIVELEKNLHDKDQEVSDDNGLNILRDKIVQLEQRNRDIEMKLILTFEKEKNYVERIHSLETNINSINQELSQTEKVLASTNKTNQEMVEKLQAEIGKFDKDPEKEAQFFRAKLLQAEAYITDLVKEVNDAKERVSSTEDRTTELMEEINRLTVESVQSDAVIRQLQSQNEDLTIQIKQLEKISHDKFEIKNQQQDVDQVKREKQLRQTVAQLVKQNQELKDQIRLQRHSDKNEIVQSQDGFGENKQSIEQDQQNIEFFKGKLFQAEAFIKELQTENESSKKALLGLNTKLLMLNEEISLLRDKRTPENSMQSNHDDSKMGEMINDANTLVADLKEQNESLRKKLASIRVQIDKKDEGEFNQDEAFLKNKLYEAQSYIVELQKENESLVQESIERQKAVKDLETNINTLNFQIVEAEALNVQYQQQKNETKVEHQQKIESVKMELEADLVEKQQQIEELIEKLKTGSQEAQQQQQPNYQDILDKQSLEIGQLMAKVNDRDETNLYLKEKVEKYEEQFESVNNNCKFFQNKLLEAEKYCTELEGQREALKESLKEKLENLEEAYKSETHQLKELLMGAEQHITLIQSERQTLRQALNEKAVQLEEAHKKVINELQSQISTMKDTTKNLVQLCGQKDERLDKLADIVVQFEEKHEEIEVLQGESKIHHQGAEGLLGQIKKISEQNNRLSEQLCQISSSSHINIQQQKSRQKQLQEEVSSLIDQLSILKREISQKNLLIESEVKASEHLQTRLSEAETANQKLAHQITLLAEVEQQFKEFKDTIRQNEEVQKQLEELEKESQNSAERQENSRSFSNKKNQSIIKSRHLEESLLQANKELQNEMKQEIRNQSKELMEQITNLKQTLEEIQQQSRVLKNQKGSQLQVIKQLSQTKHVLEEEIDRFRERQVQIEKQIVITESDNLKLKQELHQLEQIVVKNNLNSQPANSGETLSGEQVQALQEKATLFRMQIDQLSLKESQLQSQVQKLSEQMILKEMRISQLEEAVESQRKQFPQASSPEKQPRSQFQVATPNDEVESLKEELQNQRELLVMAECEIETLKRELYEAKQQNARLAAKICEIEQLLRQKLDQVDRLQKESQESQEEFMKRESIIEEDKILVEERLSSQYIEQQDRNQKLNSSLRKLITITSNLDEEKGDPAEVLSQLEEFPYLNQLIQSILYRLRLSSAIELEKRLKVESQKQVIEQIEVRNGELESEVNRFRSTVELLKEQNKLLRDTNHKIEGQLLSKFAQERADVSRQDEVKRIADSKVSDGKHSEQKSLEDERYNQLLKEVIEYEIQNNELTEQLGLITEAHQNLKNQLKDYQEHIQLLSTGQQKDLSVQNFQLRRKLEDSERIRKEGVDNSSSLGTQSLLKLQFLQVCLEKVDEIQREVRGVQSEVERVASRERVMSSSEIKQGDDSQLVERLQQLQQRLLRNASTIKEHQQKSDGELYGLLKELLNDEQMSEGSKKRINDYLTQLEQQIQREHEQHQTQIGILRQQITRKEYEEEQILTDRSRDELLREINNLNNAIEIYHQESMRRKRVYRANLESLLQEIHQLHQQRQDQTTANLVGQIQEALEKEEEEDLEFDGNDFIMTSGNGPIQVIEGRGETEGLQRLKESVGEWGGQPAQVQTDGDRKPFLEYLLAAQDIDKEDMKLLKKKIADMRGKEIEDNLKILKGKEKRLQEVMQVANRETSPQQIENVMVTLANNYSRDEISQIFGFQDADELINKLDQALCLEESFYRGQNSSLLMQQIQERKRKYYETPTKLSEQVFRHLLLLLSAKKDEEFYEQVDSLFRNMYEIEEGFENSLKKKDQVYRSHNQRMNIIFNRSSSDNSQDYLAEFERANEEEMRVQSDRKPRPSEEGSEEGSA